MLKHQRVLSGRSLAPAGLTTSVIMLAAAATRSRRARQLLAAEACLYAGAATIFAVRSIDRRGESHRLLPRVAASFPTMHLGYGAGMLAGIVRALRR